MTSAIYNHRGMGLIEFLIASTIAILVIGGALAVYLMSATAWMVGYTQITLQQEASLAMEKMTRGVNGRNGIREARNIINPAVGVTDVWVQFEGVDNNIRSFSLSGDQLMSSEQTEPIIREDVQTLTFEHLPDNIIVIHLVLEEMVRDTTVNIDLTTQVHYLRH